MKPREWAITDDGKVNILNESWTWFQSKEYFQEYYGQNPIHVIEKSYADELEKKLAIAVEALETVELRAIEPNTGLALALYAIEALGQIKGDK